MVSIVIAWKSGNTSPLVRAFVDLVRKSCGGPGVAAHTNGRRRR